MNNTFKRIEISRHLVGICHMQVCVEEDVTDAEILEYCNLHNPSGTSAGWVKVIHTDPEYANRNARPCDDCPGRIHYLVEC